LLPRRRHRLRQALQRRPAPAGLLWPEGRPADRRHPSPRPRLSLPHPSRRRAHRPRARRPRSELPQRLPRREAARRRDGAAPRPAGRRGCVRWRRARGRGCPRCREGRHGQGGC
ncbi:hypothetical protein BN1708_019799, partial [Verticillium longisporum]